MRDNIFIYREYCQASFARVLAVSDHPVSVPYRGYLEDRSDYAAAALA